MNDFSFLLKKKTKEIDEVIYHYLPKEEKKQKTIFEAMNYSVRAGGKRIRPMFLLEVYRMFSSNTELERALVWPFMTALELIHTYSLVHDDLPAMDNDMYRRGKPTTHAVYGYAMGILTGDALLNYAFELCADSLVRIPEFVIKEGDKELNQNELYCRASKAFQTLSFCSGAYGMLGGQVIDVLASTMSLTLEELSNIYDLKTAALLKAAMMIGGILAGVSNKELNAISLIASEVGLAFQIQDDILDIISTDQELGKPVHSDEKNEKSTYAAVLGIEKSKEEVLRLSGHSIMILQSLQKDSAFLEALIHSLIERNK